MTLDLQRQPTEWRRKNGICSLEYHKQLTNDNTVWAVLINKLEIVKLFYTQEAAKKYKLLLLKKEKFLDKTDISIVGLFVFRE
jgi:hypothetical protein